MSTQTTPSLPLRSSRSNNKKQPFSNIFTFFDHSRLDGWQKKSKVFHHPQIANLLPQGVQTGITTGSKTSKEKNSIPTGNNTTSSSASAIIQQHSVLSVLYSSTSALDSQRLDKSNITSVAASKNILFFSDDHGNIHTIDTHKKEHTCFVGIFSKSLNSIRVVTPKSGTEYKTDGKYANSNDEQKVKSNYLIAVGTDYNLSSLTRSENGDGDKTSNEEFVVSQSLQKEAILQEEVKIKVFEWKGAFKNSDLLSIPKSEIILPKYDKEDKIINSIDQFEVTTDLKYLAIPRGKYVYLYNDVGKRNTTNNQTGGVVSSTKSTSSTSFFNFGSSNDKRAPTIQALPSNSSINSLGFLSNQDKQGNWVLYATDKNDVYRWDLARSLGSGFVKIPLSSSTLVSSANQNNTNQDGTVVNFVGNSDPIEYGCTCTSTPFFASSFLEHQDAKYNSHSRGLHNQNMLYDTTIGKYHSAFIVLKGDEIHAFKYNHNPNVPITSNSDNAANTNDKIVKLPPSHASHHNQSIVRRKLFWYQNYLGMARVENNTPSSVYGSVNSKKGNVVLNMYDLNNTYITYDFRTQNLHMANNMSTQNGSAPQGNNAVSTIERNRKYQFIDIVPVFQQGVDTGTIFLIVKREGPMGKEAGSENFIYQLKEKPPQSKLELLIKKYQYRYAIELAKTIQQLDYDAFNSETRRKYGDYLFSQGRYQQAVRQYMQTIPLVEPSYVIRKFLDSQKNAFLIQYLLKLHLERKNNRDHTTLLLNCFMRLDDHSEEQIQLMTNPSGIGANLASRDSKDIMGMDMLMDDDDDAQDDTGMEEEEVEAQLMAKFMELVDGRDKSKIFEEFIHPKNAKLLNYDVETAIKVLRENGFRDEALKLAESTAPLFNNNPEKQRILNDWIIRIYIEDFGKWNENPKMPEYKLNFKKALRHIESLSLDQSKEFMRRYGKKLVANLPERSTNLLIRMCINYRPIPAKKQVNGLIPQMTEVADNIDDKRRIFLTQSACDELHLTDNDLLSVAVNRMNDASTFDQAPEDYIFCYAADKDHNQNQYWLMVFLEVVTSYHKDSLHFNMDKVVYNTLLELYLQFWSKENSVNTTSKVINNEENADEGFSITNGQYYDYKGEGLGVNSPTENIYIPRVDESNDFYKVYPVHSTDISTSYRGKIMDILQQRSYGDDSKPKYDREHALVLVQSSKFREGILYLYQVLGLHYDIIQYHMDKDGVDPDRKFQDILSRCREKECRDDRNVWIQALSFYAKGPGSEEPNAEKYLTSLLDEIKDNDVIPPLMVVDILCQNGKIKLSTIKQYLQIKLKSEQESIKDQTTTIKELQKETQKLSYEVEELRTSAKIFQLTQCSFCNSQLDLPAVHFMCMHSYHQRCLEKDECPKCAEKNKSHLNEMEVLKRAKESGGRYNPGSLSKQEQRDNFFKRLATNGFSVVAREFGMGTIGSSIAGHELNPYDDYDDKL
ncbi:vacuolar sorting protein [Naegleria gruberi]|uniref:Vacuolar sorting protein n=1 Tax=Naegleria gruberi TaxID=5762 RepID=D2V7F7_NAEGR|nr:vacuolar sorting protein [Naegleria gruberi]EFC47243.1 vacuolar sorting protein [Naegleria gruberi]|eukprot:XP_002679987.1 vacuolar sorting protein [Naegleria gruberi strain NEG-M]